MCEPPWKPPVPSGRCARRRLRGRSPPPWFRLVEQVTHYHYSTFRLYSEDALRAAIDTFRQRVREAFRDVTHITHDNDHVLVIAQRMGASPPPTASAAPAA